MVRVLHTADWHLGRTLHGQKRLGESAAFLKWLQATIRDESIDVLLVSGDIFDSVAPGTRALELYHAFLANLYQSDCQHVVITGGNHDSPSVLEASAAILKHLDFHVIGSARENPADEVLVLDDANKKPVLIVAAVPYLRDQDIRTSMVNESLEDKDKQLVDGIAEHYRIVAEAACKRNAQYETSLPVIGMGHLFVTGGQLKSETGDGVRDLYVGSLGQVTIDIFPKAFDYVALGHLHIPHSVGSHDHIRYSGSPIPMGFGEASQQKLVHVIDFDGKQPQVRSLLIPCFQELQQISGDWEAIESRLLELILSKSMAWLEVIYTGKVLIANLDDRVSKIVANENLKVLKIMNRPYLDATLDRSELVEKLEDLRPEDVFQRQMELKEIPVTQQQVLVPLFREMLFELENAEADA